MKTSGYLSTSTLILFLMIFFSNPGFSRRPLETVPGIKSANERYSSARSSYSKDSLKSIFEELSGYYDLIEGKVIRPAEGYLKYPYLIPAGFYQQMWDWDGFFMGNYFVARGKPEYLKYWVLNFLNCVDSDGYVTGCATTKGPRPVFGKFSMKPFLSQGALLASRAMNDFRWLEPYYDNLCKVLEYRDKTERDSVTGLYFWLNAGQSGADNNPALNYFYEQDHRSFLACDMSVMQLRELKAQSIIARELGHEKDAAEFEARAESLKVAINRYLWCNADKMYYNVDRETGKFYKRVSYSCFWPLVENLASMKDGRAMLRKYLLNTHEMKGSYGFRSLSVKDPDYNNKNIIVPFSNWQGPVWVNANCLDAIALKNYGMEKEIDWMAGTVGSMLLRDLRKYETMHESYDADTGKPLAPDQSYVDKDGKFVGFISWNLCLRNVLEGIVEGKWYTMEIR